MTLPRRHGITIPFDGVALHEHRDWFKELVDLGYTDVWSSEADGADAFTPLALAAAWEPSLRLGCAVVPAYTRGPALLAQSVASMTSAAPGRFAFGIGTSSNVIVERWNDLAFERPYQRVRDTIRFLRTALTGEKVKEEYETFAVRGFKLGIVPPEIPPILVGALRPGMLRLGGREGDGAIINWLSADDVSTVVPHVKEFGEDKEIVARIFVAVSDDADSVRGAGRFAIAAYLNVPVYQAFHEWLGRSDALGAMWSKWAEGDRGGALESIPDAVVDDLIVHGPPEACREHIQRYVDNGVDTPMPILLPLPGCMPTREAIRALAPT
jgi:probable F420-dependent oxidoreductase